ncbi:MAG: oligosaccharide flippase family protein [Candidatus Omnitrophica bacterium]|nr:oligosaccharide flippase family protein [Candidatus Omnitrophota bacterium]
MQTKNFPLLSLRENFTWTFAGNVIYSACQWAMLIVIAKLGTPEMVGRFAFAIAIATPIIMLTNLSLRSVQATDAKCQYDFEDYFGLRVITTLFGFSIIFGIANFIKCSFETSLVIIIIGLAKVFESISDVFYGLLQQNERMDRIARSMMMKGMISLALLGAIMYFTGNMVWSVAGIAVSWLLVLIFYDLRCGTFILKRIAYPRWNKKTLLDIAVLAFPLGVVMALIGFNGNIPRYFIERYVGERGLGIFAAMASIAMAGNAVINALGQSAVPRIAKYYAAKNTKAFNSLLFKMVCIGALMGAAGMALAYFYGRAILTFFYRPEYAEHMNVFFWLMFAAAILYISSFLGYAITAARYFKIQVLLLTIVTCTTLLLSAYFIPAFGLIGAAMAIFASTSVHITGNALITRYAIKNNAANP